MRFAVQHGKLEVVRYLAKEHSVDPEGAYCYVLLLTLHVRYLLAQGLASDSETLPCSICQNVHVCLSERLPPQHAYLEYRHCRFMIYCACVSNTLHAVAQFHYYCHR